jgi:uncharacterized protein (DUF2235 family)
MSANPYASRLPDDECPLERVVVCFDGTWNTPENDTNVSRIYASIADQHANCQGQLKFYDPGVGTQSGSRLRGGALGWGLDQNILQGYCWLINEWPEQCGPAFTESDGEVFDPGPDIFLFGFSRGAYTARSLAGLINRCGLPKKREFVSEPHRRARPESELVQKAWELYRKRFRGESRQSAECKQFRQEHCWTVKIRFCGVWDTVGALGVPLFSKNVLARGKYGFHDTGLCRVVQNAYHAIAIDENREDYQVALWTGKLRVANQKVEQRWFPGAHANVGGGYLDDLLPDPPLKWMAERALEHGLSFNDEFQMSLGRAACKQSLPEDFKLRGNEYLSPIRDSYGEFLGGIYQFFRRMFLRGRYLRPMMVGGTNETIDETAHLKWANDTTYRPRNFSLAGRRDFEGIPSPPSTTTIVTGPIPSQLRVTK